MNQNDVTRLSEVLIERLRDIPRRSKATDRDEAAALHAITQSLVELGVATDVGITEVDRSGAFKTVAPTSQLVNEADQAQYDTHEGPCVEAAYDFANTLSSHDVATDGRWPRWGPAAAAIGVASVISMRLYAAETAAMGALNMYSRRPRDYTSDELNIARVAAAHASVELAHYRNDSDLWQAIDSRHRIGQAQGILMERFNLDDTTAFSVLRRFSQSQNVKLAIVADTLVRTRLLPDGEQGADPSLPT